LDQSRGFDDQNLRKNVTAEKKLNFSWIKNYNLPIPGPTLMTSKLQKKPSALKREHPALQNMKFLNFILLLRVIFSLLDPDPDSEDGTGSGSTDPIESGSATLIIIVFFIRCLFVYKQWSKFHNILIIE
jgi:hypothetical protein